MVSGKNVKLMLFAALLFLAQGLLSTTAIAVNSLDIEFDDAAIRNHKVVGDKKWKQRSPGDGSKDPEFIQDVRSYFKKALTTYDKYRFLLPPLPVKVKIVISNSGDPARTKEGIIFVRTPNRVNQYAKLRHAIAHELFHAIQYVLFKPALEGKYGRGVLESIFGGPLKWWFEATAEYAAGELVWPPMIKNERRMGHGLIDPKLLNSSLTFTGQTGIDDAPIEYDRGYFIKYLVDTKNKTKVSANITAMNLEIQKVLVDKGMFKTENGLKPLDTYLRRTTKKSLWEWYRDFSGYFLFSSQRPNINEKSPDDSVTTHHTFKIDTKGKASPLKIAASIGGQRPFLPYSAEVIAVDFDFPDNDSREVRISADKRARRHNIDLYILQKSTDPTQESENYKMVSVPYRSGFLYNKTTTIKVSVTKQDVLFLVVSADTALNFASLKVEYSRCPDPDSEKFCPPGIWGKGGCYYYNDGDSCHKGLICIPYTGPCIKQGQKPYCARGQDCKSNKKEMTEDNQKEGNSEQRSPSNPCLPGQSCFRW